MASGRLDGPKLLPSETSNCLKGANRGQAFEPTIA